MTDKDRINILYTRMSTLESIIMELKERISKLTNESFYNDYKKSLKESKEWQHRKYSHHC